MSHLLSSGKHFDVLLCDVTEASHLEISARFISITCLQLHQVCS